MKTLLALLIFLGFFLTSEAQTEKEKAIDLKNQAIELMDNGKIDESLKLLEKAQQLDPDYINIPYEIAYAYQLAKDYDKSIEIAKPLLKHPDVFDLVYQLIGNSYDLKGDKKKAIKIYDKGIKKFPNSGKLYLEKGVVIASQEKWMEALEVWEQGINVDPTHSSNYYYASQILAQTDEKIWGIYYGEIFLNLEPNTKRTSQISKLVFDTYKICLPTDNNKWGLKFSHKATNIVLGSLNNLKFSFETVHNLAMEQGCKGVEPKFSVDNLITIRKQFLENWNSDYSDRYLNLIFDYHNQLIKYNMFEPYMYWLLKDGVNNEFQAWRSKNEISYNDFIEWFNENPMTFSNNSKTNRFSYD
jgi:Tetratricopeptide repeat